MLEQIQRDLFALGARLADPAHRIAERVSEGGGDWRRRRRGSSSGSTRSKRSCRRCAGSSSPADRTAARRCMSRARSAAAPSGRWSRWPRPRAGRIRAGAADLRQPAVGPAVRHGARRQPSRRIAGTRVVSTHAPRTTNPELASAYSYCERARASSTTRTFRSRRFCCLRACAPHVAAVYAFARLADDFADEGDRAAAERLAGSTAGARGCTRRPSGEPASAVTTHADVFRRACRTRFGRVVCRCRSCTILLSAFRQDVTVTRYATLGRRARLLPALRQPGRPARAAHRRLRGSGARRAGRTPSARRCS